MKNEKHIIPAKLSGLRLDHALAELSPELSRSRAARMIRTGNALLDGETAKPSALVHAGQEVLCTIKAPTTPRTVASPIELDIVFEDEQIFVINKQAGLVVHPAPGHPDDTLVNALLYHRPALAQVGVSGRPGIIHRLDKGTSGLIVVAKTDESLAHLQKQFAQRSVEKIYVAIVIGAPKAKEGTIESILGRHVRDRKKMSSTTTRGRQAITRWRVEAGAGGLSVLSCRLLTGRTHQIRVHCAEQGWPLVADKIYGGVRSLKRLPDAALREACLALDRPALHSRRLAFTHPSTGDQVSFTAPVPADLQRIISLIEQHHA